MCTENEVRVGTASIAAAFGRRHEQIKLLITKHKPLFEALGGLRTSINSGKTKPFAEWTLSEPQICLLGTLFKNSEQTVSFKKQLIAGYGKHPTPFDADDTQWSKEVLIKKVELLPSSRAVDNFLGYAEQQGATRSKIALYSEALRALLREILASCERRFPVLRNLLSSEQLMLLGGADTALTRNLNKDMTEGIYHETLHSRIIAEADMLLTMVQPLEESI